MKPIRMRAALALAACAVSLPALSGAPEQKPADWQTDNSKKIDIDVDLSKEQPTMAEPAAPGDTDWPYYNHRSDGQRFSDLTEITPANVGTLEEACRVKVSGVGPFSAGPVLVNGMIYLTAWRATMAINPVNCDIVWKALYAPEQDEVYNANRGVAWLDGRIFRGTGDARLIAYDAATGRELWRRKVGEPKGAEYVVAAPVAWNGMVFVGLAGGDFGIAGRIMAFDAATGEPRWSFNTIPHPGEFGHESWPGDTWKTGGGGTWSSFTLDTAKGELFVPVANPAPDFDAKIRKGDNLYTNSFVALDAKTGQRLWHFQARPNDNHDYGIASPPVLVDLGKRQAVAQGSKDGFLYFVDRASHKLIWKTPVTTILNHDADATPEGVKVCPGAKGGVTYNSPAYDPPTGLLIVGSIDWCFKLTSRDFGPHVAGKPYTQGLMERADDSGTGWFHAIDAKTGKIRWRHHAPSPIVAAITPTASGLTFAGDSEGWLYAFRTADGTILHRIQTDGSLAGGLITYQRQGHQYLAVTSGNVSRSSWSAVSGTPTLVVYRLPLAAQTAGGDPATLAPDIARGRTVYQGSCIVCHGPNGGGGEGPALKGMAAKYSQAAAAAYIADPRAPMPKLYPGALNAQEVADVAAYVRSLP